MDGHHALKCCQERLNVVLLGDLREFHLLGRNWGRSAVIARLRCRLYEPHQALNLLLLPVSFRSRLLLSSPPILGELFLSLLTVLHEHSHHLCDADCLGRFTIALVDGHSSTPEVLFVAPAGPSTHTRIWKD